MNKELSLILLDKIKEAPYLDRRSGLVQTFEKTMGGDQDVIVKKRIPVTAFASLDLCAGIQNLTHMIPDSHYKGMVYFEDYGSSTKVDRAGIAYNSKIRLVCWLNTNLISGKPNMLLTAVCINDILKRLCRVQNGTAYVPNYILGDTGDLLLTDNGEPLLIDRDGITFTRLTIQVANIPPQNNDIFSKYDYSENETQYLMSPFEYFAIDLNCSYVMPFACNNLITVTENPETCL